ncbi:MAG: AAA family ATPase [Clostridium celatum]|uniref:AAA family ATPase n=1 Tax=Clostridium celatum TaxID=36834 RepID=UPI001F37765F|nr:AAA family ATPase [Clostridium celatum]MCE9655653.1 AAA family ATPase [Clostridium celatum]MDU3722648.1 AAA family ATPase [Clostridium celatum]
MSKISFLKVNSFLGVDELELSPGKVNIFKGPMGSGKTSVIEAIEKTFTNKSRRTEVIKHGEEEATLFVELNDGLEIDRRLRTEKGDYLKVRKSDEGVPSTEKFLRTLVNGNIFRPLDWVNLSVKEQTKSLLSMLEINWSEQDIVNWFGDLVDDIDYSQHILLILKSIEQKYYKIREEVNREVKELNARINALYEELPAEYDGEAWREVKVQEYYAKVSEAQEINRLIDMAKGLQESFNDKVEAIKARGEKQKANITLTYKEHREDINDIIALSNSKIERANNFIDNSNNTLENELNKLDNQLESEYQALLQKYSVLKDEKKRELLAAVEEQKDIIAINNNKIATKEQELRSLDEKEEAEKVAVDEKVANEIEKEEIRIGKASSYLKENTQVDIEPLQAEADYVAEMVGYLRDWDRIIEIRDGILASKQAYSSELTSKIEKARNLPGELLKTAKMPIDGISVDVDGRVRINGVLIDGLSSGEKLRLAMKVAKAQAGLLKLICLDGWEKINEKSQNELLEEMTTDEYQYFVTQVTDTESNEVEIEKIGEVV